MVQDAFSQLWQTNLVHVRGVLFPSARTIASCRPALSHDHPSPNAAASTVFGLDARSADRDEHELTCIVFTCEETDQFRNLRSFECTVLHVSIILIHIYIYN